MVSPLPAIIHITSTSPPLQAAPHPTKWPSPTGTLVPAVSPSRHKFPKSQSLFGNFAEFWASHRRIVACGSILYHIFCCQFPLCFYRFFFKIVCHDSSAPYKMVLINDGETILPEFNGQISAECHAPLTDFEWELYFIFYNFWFTGISLFFFRTFWLLTHSYLAIKYKAINIFLTKLLIWKKNFFFGIQDNNNPHLVQMVYFYIKWELLAFDIFCPDYY